MSAGPGAGYFGPGDNDGASDTPLYSDGASGRENESETATYGFSYPNSYFFMVLTVIQVRLARATTLMQPFILMKFRGAIGFLCTARGAKSIAMHRIKGAKRIAPHVYTCYLFISIAR